MLAAPPRQQPAELCMGVIVDLAVHPGSSIQDLGGAACQSLFVPIPRILSGKYRRCAND
jgi:hypothetical protein